MGIFLHSGETNARSLIEQGFRNYPPIREEEPTRQDKRFTLEINLEIILKINLEITLKINLEITYRFTSQSPYSYSYSKSFSKSYLRDHL